MGLNIRNQEIEQELLDAIFTVGIRNLFILKKEKSDENNSSNDKA